MIIMYQLAAEAAPGCRGRPARVTPMVPVRWCSSEPRAVRELDGLSEGHPMRSERCLACGGELGVDAVVILAVGPTEEDDGRLHDEGRWYAAGAVVVHQGCQTAAEQHIATNAVVGIDGGGDDA